MNKNLKIEIAKRKAKEQRRNLISIYYHDCCEGMVLSFKGAGNKKIRYVLLSKYQFEDEYYFLLFGQSNGIHLAKIICKGMHATFKKIPKSQPEFLANKDIFEDWIRLAREEIEKEKRDFFNYKYQKNELIVVHRKISIPENNMLCKFVDKREHKGNYYFIVRDLENELVIIKVLWFEFAGLVHVSDVEKKRHKEFFETWLKEVNKKARRKK